MTPNPPEPVSDGPFDPDELLRWAESYGHPEEWAKRAQAAHVRAEAAEDRATSAEHSLSSARSEAQKLREALEGIARRAEQRPRDAAYARMARFALGKASDG